MMALLLIGGGYAWYNSEYGGTEYYVKSTKMEKNLQ